jgi:hypothetical protein
MTEIGKTGSSYASGVILNMTARKEKKHSKQPKRGNCAVDSLVG